MPHSNASAGSNDEPMLSVDGHCVLDPGGMVSESLRPIVPAKRGAPAGPPQPELRLYPSISPFVHHSHFLRKVELLACVLRVLDVLWIVVVVATPTTNANIVLVAISRSLPRFFLLKVSSGFWETFFAQLCDSPHSTGTK